VQRTSTMLVMVCGVCRCFIVLEGVRNLTSSKNLGVICSSLVESSKFDGFVVQMSLGV
jgi:hypothetical protein